MLMDMMSGLPITRIPYEAEYWRLIGAMTADEVAAVKTELNGMIAGSEIHTAGWMPGSNWSETAFQPIYDKAAQRNPDLAARCFGLMVWETFMEHPDRWTSGRFEKDGREIGSRTYFRVAN